MFKTPAQIRKELACRIIGQTEAIDFLVDVLEVYKAGLADPGRPLAVVLLLGPTGVGKTHTARTLAWALHEDEKKILKIDCGEFQKSHEIAKLIGAPPGYIGHRETRPLLSTDALRDASSIRGGISVVLFDEIEKAAPALFDLLLGLTDTGEIRMADGSVTDFSKSIIIMTSNIGSAEMDRILNPVFGLVRERKEHINFEATAERALRKRFRPEFLNRLDRFFVYRPLTREEVFEVLKREIVEVSLSCLSKHDVCLEFEPETRRALLDIAYDPRWGAREVKRTIRRMITIPLARLINQANPRPGDVVRIYGKTAKMEIITAKTKAAG